MSVPTKIKLSPIASLINAAAVALAFVALTMDASAFVFWLSLGVFDGLWNDISLQVLFVCMVISFVFLLLVAAMFGLANRMSGRVQERINVLSELGSLIDSGWDKALGTGTTCSLLVLSLLAILCLSFWRDLLWWTELCRGLRASNEHRLEDATDQYERSFEIASNDRKAISLVLEAGSFFDQKRYLEAERYFNRSIDATKILLDDNRGLLVTADQGLARTYMNEAKYAQAEKILRQCVETFGDAKVPLDPVQMRVIGSVRVPNPNPAPTLMGTLTLLEECCIKQRRFDDAQIAFEDNLRWLSNRPNAEAKSVVDVTDLYADMLANPSVNRVDLIDRAYQEADKLLVEKLGHDNLTVARLQLHYGDRLKALNLPAKALERYLTALAIYKEKPTDGDFSTLQTMNNLAGIYADLGQLKKAEALYKEELELVSHWQKRSSDVQIQVDTCRSDYANLLHKMNRDDEAKRILS